MRMGRARGRPRAILLFRRSYFCTRVAGAPPPLNTVSLFRWQAAFPALVCSSSIRSCPFYVQRCTDASTLFFREGLEMPRAMFPEFVHGDSSVALGRAAGPSVCPAGCGGRVRMESDTITSDD